MYHSPLRQAALTHGLAALTCILTAIHVNAALIAHESFDAYSAGDLNGNGAATGGWTGAWSALNSVDVVAGGLSYTSAGINISGGANAIRVNAASNLLASRTFTSYGATGNFTDTSLYFSPVSPGQLGQ